MSKPKVGIYGLTSCAGDQLVLVNCEDEILDVAGAVELKSFVMAQTGNEESELDIAFVEGVVAQSHDLDVLKDIRARAKLLVAIGTCAVWGGIPASANNVSRDKFKKTVYGKDVPDTFESMSADPLHKHVQVDLSISGCPIEKEELLLSITSLLHGNAPVLPNYPVCTECRMEENVCHMVELDQICLGPVTRAGCHARCCSHHRPCIGCRGPIEEANYASEYKLLLEKGYSPVDILNKMRIFSYPCNGVQELEKKTHE